MAALSKQERALVMQSKVNKEKKIRMNTDLAPKLRRFSDNFMNYFLEFFDELEIEFHLEKEVCIDYAHNLLTQPIINRKFLPSKITLILDSKTSITSDKIIFTILSEPKFRLKKLEIS